MNRLILTSFHPTAFRETFSALAGFAMMFQKTILPGKCSTASGYFTGEWLLAGMRTLVVLENCASAETSLASQAPKRGPRLVRFDW
jgi:hypothetical protein